MREFLSLIQRMTRLRHYDDLGTARFVTFSCYMRPPGLSEPGAMSILAEITVERRRGQRGTNLATGA